MISDDNNLIKYNIKVNCNLDYLIKEISNLGYNNTNSYYKLNIYMIPEDIDILKIKHLSLLETYIIIQDLNGENKKVIHKCRDKDISCPINNIIAVKELLKKMNYNELMYINHDIYCYFNGNNNITIKNILKQGLFIEGDIKLIDILNKLNISYDISNLYIDNEEIALKSAQNDIKEIMKNKEE